MHPDSGRGLFRRTTDGIWHVRRAVPKDLRHRFGWERIESLKTKDSRQAERRRDDFWRRCDEEFRHARLTGGEQIDLNHVLNALEAWRRDRCAIAREGIVDPPIGQPGLVLPGAVFLALERAGDGATIDLNRPRVREPSLGRDLRLMADSYFSKHPQASRELSLPPATAALMGKLQLACREPNAWERIDEFDGHMSAALKAGGLGVAPGPSLHAHARQPFAVAWLEVTQTEEWARERAAAFLAAIEAAEGDPQSLRVRPAPSAYVAREGDATVKELIKAFRSDREARHGEESTDRKYNHIFRALEEVLTPEKAVRAITRDDARKVRDVIRAIPAHMGKRYPKLTMAEAIQRAQEDEVGLLAPNTVNSYMSNLIAMLNWAVKEEWIDTNPAAGLVDDDLPLLQRRGFTPDELTKIFAALAEERAANSWKFWVPALGLYTGARLNELCQLHARDVDVVGDVSFLRITEFEPTGLRAVDKTLKTTASTRNVPLHPDLVSAGFLEFARSQSSRRLFHAIKAGPNGGYSHEPSKWFGLFLDKIGLVDPATVFHSFRHGFRDACRVAEIPTEVAEALGGWASGGEASKYGDRGMVPVLDRQLRKVSFGDFRL